MPNTFFNMSLSQKTLLNPLANVSVLKLAVCCYSLIPLLSLSCAQSCRLVTAAAPLSSTHTQSCLRCCCLPLYEDFQFPLLVPLHGDWAPSASSGRMREHSGKPHLKHTGSALEIHSGSIKQTSWQIHTVDVFRRTRLWAGSALEMNNFLQWIWSMFPCVTLLSLSSFPGS